MIEQVYSFPSYLNKIKRDGIKLTDIILCNSINGFKDVLARPDRVDYIRSSDAFRVPNGFNIGVTLYRASDKLTMPLSQLRYFPDEALDLIKTYFCILCRITTLISQGFRKKGNNNFCIHCFNNFFNIGRRETLCQELPVVVVD